MCYWGNFSAAPALVSPLIFMATFFASYYTANILTVHTKYSFWQCYVSHCNLAVIQLHILQPNIAISLKLYSSKSVTVMCTTNGCTKYSVWQCYVSHCNLAINICSVAPRVISQKQRSKQFVSRYRMRYCTSLQLKYLMR